VKEISKYFDRIEVKISNREFITHTGFIGKKRLSVLSTGIGTDNIDIVINELDALVNIDLEQRAVKTRHTALNIIRIGTTGAIQPAIPVDSYVAAEYGLGLDGLLYFYQPSGKVNEKEILQAFIRQTGWHKEFPKPYVVKGSSALLKRIGKGMTTGMTITAPGFYGPQGRVLRIPLAFPEGNKRVEQFAFHGLRIVNFEMETSSLYALGKILGHNMLTVCLVIANRVNNTFSKSHKKPMEGIIRTVLERI